MFHYTICPICQTGHDVAELFHGKKIVCKQCLKPFAVTPTLRPKRLPPLAAFPRPQARETPAAAPALAARVLSPVALQRDIVNTDAQPPGGTASSSGSRWGTSAAIIVFAIVLLIRLVTSAFQHPPAREPMPQFKIEPAPEQAKPNWQLQHEKIQEMLKQLKKEPGKAVIIPLEPKDAEPNLPHADKKN